MNNEFKNKKFEIILEIANNHDGDLFHAIDIINRYSEICSKFKDKFDFYFKFQYRDLDSYIHRDHLNSDNKLIQRFTTTKFSDENFLTLSKIIRQNGFFLMCTPFDEASVEKVYRQGFDKLKIASACIDDWSLHEKISSSHPDVPLVISTGGANFDQIDNIVSYYKHRNRNFSLLHCVGLYPTPVEATNLSRIDYLRKRYSDIDIGFSSHETPDTIIFAPMALAKGAIIFEKHIGLAENGHTNNKYSTDALEFYSWISNLNSAVTALDPRNSEFSSHFYELERNTIFGLKRGAYLKNDKRGNSLIDKADIYFATPRLEHSLGPENFGISIKGYSINFDIPKNGELTQQNVTPIKNFDHHATIANILHKCKAMLSEANIILGSDIEVEISHHDGLENFQNVGAVIITAINTEHYAKKLIIQIGGQTHPLHMHPIKNESFQVLWGLGSINLNGTNVESQAGDIHHISSGQMHGFSTDSGWILEEISTKAIVGDSVYKIDLTKARKTNIKDLWLEF